MRFCQPVNNVRMFSGDDRKKHVDVETALKSAFQPNSNQKLIFIVIRITITCDADCESALPNVLYI